jgi:hypothetical protein
MKENITNWKVYVFYAEKIVVKAVTVKKAVSWVLTP